MLDLKLIRDNFDEVVKRLNLRNGDFSYLDKFIEYDEERRNVIKEVEELKAKRNQVSKLIGQYKKRR